MEKRTYFGSTSDCFDLFASNTECGAQTGFVFEPETPVFLAAGWSMSVLVPLAIFAHC